MDSIFKNKKINLEKIVKYGFKLVCGEYSLDTEILDGQFKLLITISKEGQVTSTCIDVASGEEYVLHLLPNAEGVFVGKVREAIEDVLLDISEKCFEEDNFRCAQTKELVKYVSANYNDKPEFLWEDENAVWRRKDNGKWYGVILTVKRNKFGFENNDLVEVIDLRADPADIDTLVDDKKYFRGYHMNKKHWLTIILDGSVSTDEICRYVDRSYDLAKKNK